MNKHLWTVIGVLAVASLACNLPGTGDSSTAVTLTEEAPAGEAGTESTTAPTEAPTSEASTGARIVFPRNQGGVAGDDDQLWLWDETDGLSAAPLTTTGNISAFAISDDGQQVAWVHESEFLYYDLWAVNADGSDERMLVSLDELATLLDDPYALAVAPFQIGWIAGTHRLLYNTRYTYEGPGLALRDDLWMVDVDSGEVTQLAGAGEGGRFHLSPDASQIAVVRPDGISVMDIDGGNRRDDLLTIEPIGAGEGVIYVEPVWTPDGSRLLVSVPPQEIFAEFPEASTSWEIMADGSGIRELTSLNAFPLLGPHFSPNGTQVVYQRSVGERIDNTWEMHVANIDGSQDVVYDTGRFLMFLGFSPDGTRFVYQIEQSTTIIGGPGIEPTAYPDLTIINFGPELLQWADATHFAFIKRSGELSYSAWLGSIEDGSAVQIGDMGEVRSPQIAVAP